MVDYTALVTTTFEMQRQSIEQSRAALGQAVQFQQRLNATVLDGIETQETAQRQAVEFQQETLHATLDAIEENVPGTTERTDDIRDTVDEQFALLLDNHAELFETLAAEFENGTEMYDDAAADALAALDDQLDLLVEAHEEVETQSVDATEDLAEGMEELQSQAEELTEQMQEASEQAVETAETVQA